MNQYVTGAVIKELREKHKLTQSELADKLNVSDKTISKWETGKGYPDITLLEPIAEAFGVSVTELISGKSFTSVRSAAILSTAWVKPSYSAMECSYCHVRLKRQMKCIRSGSKEMRMNSTYTSIMK